MSHPEAQALLETLRHAASLMDNVKPENLDGEEGNEVVGLVNRCGSSKLYLKCLSKAAELLKKH